MQINEFQSKLRLVNQRLKVFPQEILNTKNLLKLNLSNNNIEYIPSEILKLKRLENIDISDNRIRALYSNFFELRKLKVLNLNNNRLKNIPKQICKLKSLKVLNLAGNNLSKLPAEFVELENLEKLNISKNNFSTFPSEILKLKSLKTIWLSNNLFTDFPLQQIKNNLINLERIYCFGTKISSNLEIDKNFLILSRKKGNSIMVINQLVKSMSKRKNTPRIIDGDISDIKIFISYSHDDVKWLNRVKKHLKVLNFENNNLDIWDDTKIKIGENWKEKIKESLSTCKIAILLVSTDFLASDFIRHNELPPLLEKARSNRTLIMPLIIEPCRFTRTKQLAHFQAVNDPSNPLSKLNKGEQESLLVELTTQIEDYVNSIKQGYSLD